jgi:hypothetical protein
MPLSPELRGRYEAAQLVCLDCEPPTSYEKSPYAWYYGPEADGRVLLLGDVVDPQPAYLLSFLREWVCSVCGAPIDVPEDVAEHARHIALLRSVGSYRACGDDVDE